MSKDQQYFNPISFVLSRFAFVGTHLVFALWLVFLFNDPFNFAKFVPFKIPTVDVTESELKPESTCTPLNTAHLYNNLAYFGLWWGTHSGLARTATKKFLGLVEHPIERPLFATVATITWFLQVYTWQPITDCSRWDVISTPTIFWAISGFVMLVGTVLIVGLLWTLPDHVFGTGKYKYPQGQFPEHKVIKGTFPYGLVRHPAAAGFLWFYWALPSYTPNHLLLAVLWTVFIVLGTIVFEEVGISDENTEFGREYVKYRKQVWAFFPTINSTLTVLGLKKFEEEKSK